MKLTIPKIKTKIELPAILWAIFLLIVLFEAWILYQTLYLNSSSARTVKEATSQTKLIDFDISAFNQIRSWLEDRRVYQAPDYNLSGAEFGRDNPFADYK